MLAYNTNALRRASRGGELVVRRPTARWRGLPTVLLVGAQKSGTSFLYRCLTAHPEVHAPLVKETHFFSDYWEHGEGWYRSHFPVGRPGSHRGITVDATPYYLFHPLAASRAAQLVPKARIVILLRDPVARAYSHYWHSLRNGWEQLDFASALRMEPLRLDGEAERITSRHGYRSIRHRAFSYASRGHYPEQVARWTSRFPAVYAIRSEDFFREPARHYQELLDFLELDSYQPEFDRLKPKADERRPEMPDALRALLRESYAGEAERLTEILGRPMSWER